MFHTKVWMEQMTSTSYSESKGFCGSDVPQQTSPGGSVEGEKEKGPTSVLLLPLSAPGEKTKIVWSVWSVALITSLSPLCPDSALSQPC